MITPFQNYLRGKSVEFFEDSEGKVRFKLDGLNFLFISTINDPYYFRLLLLNVREVSESYKTNAYEEINKLNLRYKVAKAMIMDNTISIALEQMVYSEVHIDILFDRGISILKSFIKDVWEVELKQ